jgi:hypothetical protein
MGDEEKLGDLGSKGARQSRAEVKVVHRMPSKPKRRQIQRRRTPTPLAIGRSSGRLNGTAVAAEEPVDAFYPQTMDPETWETLTEEFADNVLEQSGSSEYVMAQLHGLSPDEQRDQLIELSRPVLSRNDAGTLYRALLATCVKEEMPPDMDSEIAFMEFTEVLGQYTEGVPKDDVFDILRSSLNSGSLGSVEGYLFRDGKAISSTPDDYSPLEEHALLGDDTSLAEEVDWREHVEFEEEGEFDRLEAISETEPERQREKIIDLKKGYLGPEEAHSYIAELAATYTLPENATVDAVIEKVMGLSPSKNGSNKEFHKRTLAGILDAGLTVNLSAQLVFDETLKSYDSQFDRSTAKRFLRELTDLMPGIYTMPEEDTPSRVYRELCAKMPSVNGECEVYRKKTLVRMVKTRGLNELTPVKMQSLIYAQYDDVLPMGNAMLLAHQLIAAHLEHCPEDVEMLHRSFAKSFQRDYGSGGVIEKESVQNRLEQREYLPRYDDLESGFHRKNGD